MPRSLVVVATAALGACGGDDTGTRDGAAANGGAGGDAAAGGSAGTTGGAGAAGAGGDAAGGSAGGSGASGTGAVSGAAGAAASAGTGGAAGAPACLATPLLESIGKSHVLVGASMDDSVATQAPFDLRYQYLSGGVADGAGPCADCSSGCTAQGTSCANGGPGCAWWGCWQYDQDPPGAFVRDFVQRAAADRQIPMITYYMQLHASGVGEGDPQVSAASDVATMGRYLADWRFVLQQVGGSVAFLHIEPDFWGYAQQRDPDATRIPAAVASANPTDCGGEQNTIAGLGRCMIGMVRKHAPNAKVSLHASGWATKMDVLQNRDAGLDVRAEARSLADFMTACGGGDFITIDPSDRDAAWYDTQGQDRWWDETNATLPNFAQAFTWATELAEATGLPIVWWQVPVGNASLPNLQNRWKDNRVDYLFGHMDEVARSHGVAVAFGAGDGNQTTPSTDGGNLVSKVSAYATGGREPACR